MLKKLAKEVGTYIREVATGMTIKMNDWNKMLEHYEQIEALSNDDFVDAIIPAIREVSEKTGKQIFEYCEEVEESLLRGEKQSEILYRYISFGS